MSVTLFREESYTSQHPSYRIPASVELNSWTYPVQEWSLEGFSVAGVHDGNKLQVPLPVRFIFRFDSFSTHIDLKAELIDYKEDDKILNCRFYKPSQQQLSVLRTIIDAYLAGEFVSMNELIYAIRQDSATLENINTPKINEINFTARLLHYLKRGLGLTALAGLFVGLLLAIGWIAYQRLYVIEGLSAVVSAPIVVIRAPQSSYFEPIQPVSENLIPIGEPLAYMELIGGGAATIDNPCHCKILEYHLLPRQFVSQGEPVMSLLPNEQQAFIRAQLDMQSVQQVKIGHIATIQLADGREVQGRIARLQYSEPLERRLSAPLSSPLTNVIAYVEATIIPDTELPLDLLGTPAAVQIDTFKSEV